MKTLIFGMMFLLLQRPVAFANGGAAAIDEMILHQKSGLEKAKTARQKSHDQELNRLFDDLISAHEKELKQMNEMRDRLYTEAEEKVEGASPKVEIKEDQKGYDIKAEVPGMDRKDIKVKVVKNELLIEGKREEEIKREQKGITSSEFTYGEFSRSIPLNEKVDPKSIKTDYKDGILMVHLKKIGAGKT